VIRVAAVGDLHIGTDAFLDWRHAFAGVSSQADLLLLAGDLTQIGAPAEAKALLSALGPVTIPIVAVLGNHDYHSGCAAEIGAALRDRGVRVAVHDQVRAGAVHGLSEQVTAEERVDLQVLALKRLRDRRVVQQRHAQIDVERVERAP